MNEMINDQQSRLDPLPSSAWQRDRSQTFPNGFWYKQKNLMIFNALSKKFLPIICCAISFFSTHTFSFSQRDAVSLFEKLKRYTPAVITADTSKLSPGDRKALRKLIETAKLMDSIYIRQVWSGNIELLSRVRADNSPEGRERLHYFTINMSPWSKLDNGETFLNNVPELQPLRATFYPDDLTRLDFSKWIISLSERMQQDARGPYTIIRRDSRGNLKAIPYSEEYKQFLEPAARLLREAASFTKNQSLKTFLTQRADAFITNNYYESERTWMDLNSDLQPTIGPYEGELDKLFQYKTACVSFIMLKNEGARRMSVTIHSYLPQIEHELQIDSIHRNPYLSRSNPFQIADAAYISGAARAGILSSAYAYAVDERIFDEKGIKRVMIKNVQQAKFNKILQPIAQRVIESSQRSLISFEPFFIHTLTHEYMHELGPHTLMINGLETPISQRLKEYHSALEEAKADISALVALQYLIDKGVLKKSIERPMYVSYLASIFRSLHTSTKDAHGRGMSLALHYLINEGAFKLDDTKNTVSVDFTKIKDAVKTFTGDILSIQSEGNYNRAKALFANYGQVSPSAQKILDKISQLPVEIEARFPLAE